jgi:hypothetical protein
MASHFDFPVLIKTEKSKKKDFNFQMLNKKWPEGLAFYRLYSSRFHPSSLPVAS